MNLLPCGMGCDLAVCSPVSDLVAWGCWADSQNLKELGKDSPWWGVT